MLGLNDMKRQLLVSALLCMSVLATSCCTPQPESDPAWGVALNGVTARLLFDKNAFQTPDCVAVYVVYRNIDSQSHECHSPGRFELTVTGNDHTSDLLSGEYESERFFLAPGEEKRISIIKRLDKTIFRSNLKPMPLGIVAFSGYVGSNTVGFATLDVFD